MINYDKIANELAMVHERRKVMEARERELKADLFELMKAEGVEAIHTTMVSIDIRRETVDLEKIESTDPEFYNELVNDVNLKTIKEYEPDLYFELFRSYPKRTKTVDAMNIVPVECIRLDELY